MAVSQSQIIDLLYKEAFGVTKTDTATNKSPSNESIPSPALNRGDTQWTQSDQIPGTAAAVAGVVQAYLGVDAIECTADNTTVPVGGIYPTWVTNLTYWIPAEFGSTYNVQIWVDSPGVANPTATGTQIFADGSGGTGQWFYNYQSGVLNFIGETIPASLTAGKVLYVVGYRYIGLVGVTDLPSGTKIGNLTITGSNIASDETNANINISSNGTGVIVSNANVYAPTFIGNIVGNISGNITIGGANTQLIFNDNGIANGNANLTFNKANSLLTLAGILSVSGNTSIGGNLNMSSQWINNVGYPNLSTDAATKSYVDTMVSTGIAYHAPVNVATTTTLAVATGGTTAYNSPNGAANGIGAYISTTGTFLNIDSANVQTIGTRILVKDEANAAWNGIYEYSNTTAITRTTDADQYGPDSTEQLSLNDYFFTLGGTVNEGTAFVVASPPGTITFGTSNITFSVFSQSQVYDAGTGIAITGTTISTTANQSHVTAVGTLTNLSVAGNANIGNIGTGGFITATGNITGANILTGGIVSATGNGTFGNISTTGSGGNITGANVVSANTFTATANVTAGNLNTGGLLTVTGNANIGNIGTSGLLLAIGNITGGNLVTGGAVSATGNITGANLVTGGLLSVTGNANIGNIGTGLVTATGNITGANITTGGLITSTGNITGGNLNTGGLLTVTGNANIGNIGTGGLLLAIGNITGGNLITGGVVSATGNVSGSNLIASYGVSSPNITSNTNVNFSGAGNVFLGNVSNLHITGGTPDQILKTDGNGNLSWSSGTALVNGYSNVTIPNANGNVYINANAGVDQQWIFGADGNLTGPAAGLANLGNLVIANFANIASNTTTSNLTVNLELSGNTANFTGNIKSLNANLGNLATANFVNVSSNLSVTDTATIGNITANNLTVNLQLSGNTANFTGNVITNNLTVNLQLSGNTANFTGNITSLNANLGNLATANFINVSSNLFVTDTANVGNLRTNNLLYANGQPWDLQEAAGANTQIQYNDGNNNFGASSKFTFDYAGNVLTVDGNANITGTTTTGQAELTSLSPTQLVYGNANSYLVGSANLAFDDVAGNLIIVGNVIATNFVGNISGNLIAPGANTQVVFNDNNVANAVANFAYDKSFNSSGGRLNVGNTVGGEITTDTFYANYANLGLANVSGNIVSGGNIATTGSGGNVTMTGGDIVGANVASANTFTAATNVNIGNTHVGWGTTTTSNINANQTIAQFSTTGIAAIEFLVKGEDAAGGKYSVATVTAVTNGTNVDYVIYASAFLTSGTGALAVNISGGNVALQVTPSSSNSTVWTTQYRIM